jgi:hypothetical protein
VNGRFLLASFFTFKRVFVFAVVVMVAVGKKVIFKKSTFSVVCVYILCVWLKVWFDFIVVKTCLVKTVVAVDIVPKIIKNDINEIILCVKRK